MHHVACPHDAPQFTLSHVAVEACRLLVCVDEAVLIAGNDDDGVLQAAVASLHANCVGDHQSCFRRAGPYLRGPHRHLFWEAIELVWHRRRPENLS